MKVDNYNVFQNTRKSFLNQTGKSLSIFAAAAGAACLTPFSATLAAGAFFLGAGGAFLWNKARKVDVQSPASKLEPLPEAIRSQPDLKTQSQTPSHIFTSAPEVFPPIANQEDKPIPPSPKKQGIKRKREEPISISATAAFPPLPNQKDEPISTPPKKQGTKRKREEAANGQPPVLKCKESLGKRTRGRSALQKIDASALQKALQKNERAVALAQNLQIDLERANSAELQNLDEITNLISTVLKSPQSFCRKPFKSPQYLSRNETGLSRDVKFHPDGSILILDQLIGQGTFKSVWRAIDAKTLQVYASSEYLISNEETEAEMQFVRHFQKDSDGLVRTYSIETYTDSEGKPHTAMLQEYYGPKLSSLLDERRLSKKDKLQIAYDISTALVKVHKKFCHLDIKPDNILTSFDERGDRRGVLADYDQNCKIGTQVITPGTETFKAPELEGNEEPLASSPKMDIYSLGVTFKKHLFKGAGLSTLSKSTQGLVKRMVDLNPDQRPTAAEIARAFEQELAGICPLPDDSF